MILEALSDLALLLKTRSSVLKKPEDAIYAAKYLRYLRGPAHTLFASRRQKITVSLVEALALQMELKPSDVLEQTLEEMTALTQELLTLDPSSDLTTRASAFFAGAAATKLLELSPDLLNKIIECLRLARMHKPELQEVPYFLSRGLYIRYSYTLNDELDEVVSILDETIASSPPGYKFLYQKFVAHLAMFRGPSQPEHSEEAIYRARAFLASSSVEDPLYSTWSKVLEDAAKNRFKSVGPIDGLEASSASSSSDPLLADPVYVAWKTSPLQELLHGISNFSITDIEGAI